MNVMDEWQGMHEEVMALREALDGVGERHHDMGAFTTFMNDSGECHVFPSLDRPGKFYVSYCAVAYCDTVEDTLRICGLLGDEDAAE